MASLAQQVKQLREMTGAGPKDCKEALEANDFDIEKAANYLREKGIAKGKKKLGKGRAMGEGLIEIYQHHDQRMGAMVEVNCETDFVARNEIFQQFARDLALHIASMRPEYVTREEVPQDRVDAEKAVLMNMEDLEGKPENIKEKIVDGRLDKWYQSIVLMEQEFLKDDSKTISELVVETVAEIGESIQISRFARFSIDDGADDEAGDDEE